MDPVQIYAKMDQVQNYAKIDPVPFSVGGRNEIIRRDK